MRRNISVFFGYLENSIVYFVIFCSMDYHKMVLAVL